MRDTYAVYLLLWFSRQQENGTILYTQKQWPANKKVVCIYTIESYWARKKIVMVKCAGKWKELENIFSSMLSDRW